MKSRGVYGAVERRLAAPAVVGRLGLVLDTKFRFWGHDDDDDGRTDGRNRAPPPFSSNRKPQRNSDLDFRFFAVSKRPQLFCDRDLRAVVRQNVDFLEGVRGIKKKNFGRNVSIPDVRYVLESSWASGEPEPGFSSRRRGLPIFFVSWGALHHRPKH